MGNRPINRRPWRRKPWGKRSQRPKRWNAVTLSRTGEGASVPDFVTVSLATAALPPVLTLVSGQIDVEPWADEQEVLLDRVVGSITLGATAFWDSGDIISSPSPFVKLGLLVNEEISQEVGSLPMLDMWDQETMEDYEWMWMWSGYLEHITTRLLTGTQYLTEYNLKIDIDLRNRRKIGQSDELNLYGSFAPAYFHGDYIPSVQAGVDVRTMLVSK